MDDMPPDFSVEEIRIADGLQACGLDRAGFTVDYEPEFQSFVIVVSKGAGASEASFECIHGVVGSEPVGFENADLERAYQEYVHDLMAREIRADAERYLGERGLLEAAPTLAKIGNLANLGIEMERLCGFEPGSVLTVDGDSLTMGGDASALLEADYDQSACLLALIKYSGVSKFGFVGNEKYRAEDD